MINSIIDAMCIAINNEFGDDFEIYTESIKQGFKEPCFIVCLVDADNNLYRGRRYQRFSRFCINFFPSKGEENKKCNDSSERLYRCLEWINADGMLLRGTKMKHDILDSVLNFFVDYNMFEYKTEDLILMGDLTMRVNDKR